VSEPEVASDVCVWCDRARAVPDGMGGIVWIVTMATPDCEHETIAAD
jgi:hypothetical protein